MDKDQQVLKVHHAQCTQKKQCGDIQDHMKERQVLENHFRFSAVAFLVVILVAPQQETESSSSSRARERRKIYYSRRMGSASPESKKKGTDRDHHARR